MVWARPGTAAAVLLPAVPCALLPAAALAWNATRTTLGLAPRIQGVSTVTSSSYVHWTVRDGTGQWNSAARASLRATEDQPKSADENDAGTP